MSFNKYFLLFPLVVFSFILPTESYASPSAKASEGIRQENELLPVVTVINPIRGGEWHGDKVDLLESLKGQWKAVEGQQVNATWIWQYTALEDERMVQFAKEQMKDQEFGLFFEIDRNTAAKAGVQYRGQGALYESDGLLLVSYDKEERRKLIDASFAKFKETFGYYPKTVGAWWIGGDSLTYMQQKYGIVAAMKAADQFDLDAYSIWGGPWSIPFVASKENEGIPARSFDDSSKVVIIQWAPRDPLNGYADAMFSLQDKGISGYPFSYVDYISSIYLKKPLDNVNVGLENGNKAEDYESYFNDKLTGAKKLKEEKKIEILTVKDYAEKFLSQKKVFANADVHYFISKDYKSEGQSFWYHSPNYRVGIHKQGEEIYLVDLRDYSRKVDEDFSFLPNSQGKLKVSTPAIIDSMRMPSDKLLIANSKEQLEIEEKDGLILLVSGKKKIAEFNKSSLEIFPDKKETKSFAFKENGLTLDDRAFLFDKKELLLLSVMPVQPFASISHTLVFYKVIPLVFLFFAFYIVLSTSLSWKKPFFYFMLIFVILLYSHIPYFPLDRSTYPVIAIIFIVFFLMLFMASLLLLRKKKSKELFVSSLISIPIILGILGGVIFLSRSWYVVTPFEMDALQVIKDKKKDVLFVEEYDYGIRPIYKAVKPLLYEDYRNGEKLTLTDWETVQRPVNNLLRLSKDETRLVVVPRYLGSDFSNDEMKMNNYKKIFDNGQIAIFEKK